MLWFTSSSLLSVAWALVIALLGMDLCLHFLFIKTHVVFSFSTNTRKSVLFMFDAATLIHASLRTPNLKARLNTFREEFRAVWRNYSELWSCQSIQSVGGFLPSMNIIPFVFYSYILEILHEHFFAKKKKKNTAFVISVTDIWYSWVNCLETCSWV